MLGLLAMMLAGSVMAASASAVAGPFWHHRPVGETKNTIGEKIEPKAPENFSGTGGTQTLRGKIGSEPIEIVAKSEQVKGAIFNTALQGQIKLELVYGQPTLVKPALKECSVVVGEKNIVVTHGHIVWKWDGTQTQLNAENQVAAGQKPDLIFTPAEIASGAEELPKGEFTKISLKGAGCGVLAGSFKVEGSEVGLPSPSNVEEWSTTLGVNTVEGTDLLQHFWNGTKFVGVSVQLLFDSNPANLIGQTTASAAQQEIAVFER